MACTPASGILRLTRACATAGAVILGTALPLAAGSARAEAATTGRQSEAPGKVALSVTSLSPSYATPGPNSTIKMTGRVWNGTGSSITGLSVQLSFSPFPFGSNTALEGFAAGTMPVSEGPSVASRTIGKLPARHGAAWHLSLPVSSLPVNCFGVYPLTATLVDVTGTPRSNVYLPLPFWPNKATSCATALRPSPFLISWIWPLIDSPHQGPCPGLLDNGLAASLARGGRLDELLAVGASYARTAHLTWAIDPALLDDARTMSGPYPVGTSPKCVDTAPHTADPNAAKWLTKLTKATAGQPVFVTPYADVDVAGLAQYGDDTDLRMAFTDGQQLAAPLLGRSSVPAKIPAGPRKLSAVAWPAGGLASDAVLENLGAMRIGTIILAMPPQQQLTQLSFTPGAVTSVASGVGTKLKALLADYSLTSLLASGAASSRQSGTIFDVSQLFLAETAWIVAEAPSMPRPILVAPPRRWDPAPGLAADLLGDTVSAPWLRPVSIGKLADQPADPPQDSPALTQPSGRTELPRKVLRQIARLDSGVSLLQSIRPGGDAKLSHALYGVESSAWAGDNVPRARAMLARTRKFVTAQFAGLSVGGRHVIHVTLGGRVGSVTVSIHNSLGYPIKVGLQVTSSNNTVTANQKHPHEQYSVLAHSITELKLSVNATQTGKATLTLSLRTPSGARLPVKPLIMTIQSTNLGTVALVIFAAALTVFVAASATQAIRRGRPGTAVPPDVPPEPVGPSPSPAGIGATATAAEPGNLDTAESGESAETAGARLRLRADRDRPTAPDLTDNVVPDGSELSSVGHVIARVSRPIEESR